MRLLLLVAGLAYGAMPLHGIAATAMPAPATSAAGDTMATGAPAHVHGAVIGLAVCPHGMIPADHSGEHSGQPMMAGGHCGSCLTLPLMIVIADAGLAVRSVDAPGLSPRLHSAPIGPLERPPRIRG